METERERAERVRDNARVSRAGALNAPLVDVRLPGDRQVDGFSGSGVISSSEGAKFRRPGAVKDRTALRHRPSAIHPGVALFPLGREGRR